MSWDSPLVLPLAGGFIVMGYLTTLGTMVGVRTAVRKIVQRIRDQHLTALQRRIDAYGPRFPQLSSEESEQVQKLISLHHTIRDAPASPKTTHTLLQAAVALIIPTMLFFVTVLARSTPKESSNGGSPRSGFTRSGD